MNRKTIAIIVLSLIIIGGLIFYGYEQTKEDSYLQGYNQGQADIIIKINTEGVVPVIYQEGEETRVNWVSITNEEVIPS